MTPICAIRSNTAFIFGLRNISRWMYYGLYTFIYFCMMLDRKTPDGCRRKYIFVFVEYTLCCDLTFTRVTFRAKAHRQLLHWLLTLEEGPSLETSSFCLFISGSTVVI
jgi:hypothetical protein